MNKIFKVIWNQASQSFIVVSELTKSKGKNASKIDKRSSLTPSKGLINLGATGSVVLGMGSAILGSSALSVASIGTALLATSEAQAAITSYGNGANATDSNARNANGTVIGLNARIGVDSVAVGPSANASGGESVAVGNRSRANGYLGTALGSNSNASGASGVAIGTSAKSSGDQSTAIGGDANASGYASVAIGADDIDGAKNTNATLNGQTMNLTTAYTNLTSGTLIDVYPNGTTRTYRAATASGVAAVAIGSYAQSSGHLATSIGTNATSSGLASMAVGVGALATETTTLAMGAGANATAIGAIAIGRSADATANISLAIGVDAQATKDFSVALGQASEAKGNFSNALGSATLAAADNSTAVGYASVANATSSLAMGDRALANVTNTTAIGTLSTANATNATALGTASLANAENSTAIGTYSTANSTGAIAFGTNATANALNTTAIGSNAKVSGDYSAAIGTNNNVTGNNTFVFGSNISAATNDSVILGNGSTSATATSESNATVNGISYGDFAGQANEAGEYVSVGSSNDERQIKNVAAGAITATSTDAINGSQLYVVANNLTNAIKENTSRVIAGTNVNVGSVSDANGTNYTINAYNTTAQAGSSAVTVNGTFNNSTNTTNYVIDLSDATKQNITTALDTANTANNTANTANTTANTANSTANTANTTANTANETVNKGWNITTSKTGTGNVSGTTNKNVQMGETVTITAGNNVNITQDQGQITIAVSDNPTFTNVTTTNLSTNNINVNNGGTVNMGNNIVNNVAAGVSDNDAVNVKQLTDNITNVTNNITNVSNELAKGWNITTTASTGKVNGNSTEQINMGETVTLDAGENIEITQDKTNITIATSKTPTFTNVTVGDTKITNEGLTINNGPSITNNGINAGNTTVTNVANGTNPTDAVNLSQLNASKAAVVEGKNVNVTSVSDANGTTYTVNAWNTTAQGSNDIKVTSEVNATNQTIDYTIDLSDSAKNNITTANNTANIANATANTANETVNKGWNITTSKTGTGNVTGTSNKNIQMGETVTLTAGDNINITQAGDNITIATSATPTFTNVTVGDTKITNEGLTINNGPSITNSGINANNKTITNVANGTNGTDAVNLDQLNASTAAAKTEVTSNNKTVTVTNSVGNEGQTVYNVEVTKSDVTVNTTTGRAETNATNDAANNSFVTVNDVVNAVNNAYWTVQGNGNVVNNVSAGNIVNFINGTGTTANVTPNGTDVTNVTFNVKTSTLTVNQGNVTAGTSGDAFANATEVAKAIEDSELTSNVTAGDSNIVVTNTTEGNNTEFFVSLAKDLNLTSNGSVTMGNTVINNSGLTINNGPSITTDGINANNTAITNVANGTNPTDAVNLSQLNASAAAAKTEVTSNNGTITVTSSVGADKQTIYNVEVNTTEMAYNSTTGNIDVGDENRFATAGDIAKAITDAELTSSVVSGNENLVVTSTVNGNNTEYKVTMSNNLNLTDKGSVTIGNTTLNNDGITINNGPSITTDGINANNTTITNVANGTNPTDAVNLSQLNASAAAAKTEVTSNNGTITVTSSTGSDKQTIYNVEVTTTTATVTDGKASVVDGNSFLNGTTVVNLVNNASWRLNTDTVDGSNGQNTYSTNADSAIKAGDIVNYKAGQNIVIGGEGNNLSIATNPNSTFDSVTANNSINVGNVTISANGKISGVANGDISPTSTEAINGSQLYATSQNIANYFGGNSTVDPSGNIVAPAYDIVSTNGSTTTVNNVGDAIRNLNDEVNKPLIFNGDTGSGSSRTLGSTVTVKGGISDESQLSDNNIGVVSDGKGTLTVKLAKDINVNSVTAKTLTADSIKAGDTTINNNGVSITGGPSITKNGIDAANQKVTNVKAGEADTDAVNVGQLKTVSGDIYNRINKTDKTLRAGIAGANAAAGLPQVYTPGKSMVAAAAGAYKGESALAVGYSRASDNGKLILKLQGNANSRGDVGGSVGVGYQW